MLKLSYIFIYSTIAYWSPIFITVSPVIYDIFGILIAAVQLFAIQFLPLNSVAPTRSSGQMNLERNRMCYYIILKRYSFQLVIFPHKSIQN